MFGNHVSKKLSACLHGELSAEDARRVAEHLRGCQSCRTELEEIEFGFQLASQLKYEQAPESLWDELESAMNRARFSPNHRTKARQKKFGLSWPTLKVGLAGAATLAIAVLTFVFLNRQPKPIQPLHHSNPGSGSYPSYPAWKF